MGLQAYISSILTFLNTIVVPFIMLIAFLFFMVNMLRYFIIGGANEDAQTKAKSLAVWGILAFVFISSLWGIVNVFLNLFGIIETSPILPDYYQMKI